MTGESLSGPILHAGTVLSGVYDSEGRRIVTPSEDQIARVWDLMDASNPSLCFPHPAVIWKVVFAPKGERMIVIVLNEQPFCGSPDRKTDTLVPHELVGDPVRRVRPDNSRVAVGCSDGTARIWDLAAGQPASPLLKHEGQ